jgi:hypothetical protein
VFVDFSAPRGAETLMTYLDDTYTKSVLDSLQFSLFADGDN